MRLNRRVPTIPSILLLVAACGDTGSEGDTSNSLSPTDSPSTTNTPGSPVFSSGPGTPMNPPPTGSDPAPLPSPSNPLPPPNNGAGGTPPSPDTPSPIAPPNPAGAGGMPTTSGGSGGDTPLGGNGSGGASEVGGMGSGGEAMGGSGGSDGETGPDEPVPSMGCGETDQQLGSAQSPLNVSNHQYYVKLPTNYDPNTAYPVLFMFNPTNNPISWAENSAGFENTQARDNWIRVYPHPANSASGWGAGDVSFFEPLYNNITSGFCVDESRVFAAGESSGGDFSSILGCEYAHLIRATGPCATKPVGGYALDANSRSCTGQVGAVVIHGANDNVVGPENGPATRDFYKALNHCGDESVPVEGYTDSLSNCVEFQGCDPGFPVIWCQHNDPEYSNTNHGWPRFAAEMLTEHFSSY